MATRSPMDLERHPDIAAMRAHYDLAAEMPVARVVSGLTFLSGLYLAISPWVVGFFGRTTLTVNNLVLGVALALLAAGFASAFGRTHGFSWVTPIIGVWTIVAPWVLPEHGATTAQTVSNATIGAIITVCGLAGLGVGLLSPYRR